MINYTIPLTILIVLLLTNCSPSYRISSDYERQANFNKYQTYQLLKRKKEFDRGLNPINSQRVERAIQKELANLGYRPEKNPDLVVAFYVRQKTIREVEVYNPYWPRWRYPGWVDVQEYTQGTLILDLIDRETKQVIWHGAAEGSIFDSRSNPEKKINKAVHQLFKAYSQLRGTDRNLASSEY